MYNKKQRKTYPVDSSTTNATSTQYTISFFLCTQPSLLLPSDASTTGSARYTAASSGVYMSLLCRSQPQMGRPKQVSLTRRQSSHITLISQILSSRTNTKHAPQQQSSPSFVRVSAFRCLCVIPSRQRHRVKCGGVWQGLVTRTMSSTW